MSDPFDRGGTSSWRGSPPRRTRATRRWLTLRPGNWVRLTADVVAHLRLQVDDVIVTGLKSDHRVELQSLDDWCEGQP